VLSPELAQNLCAIILLTMLGLAAGNYATSIVYRLPRGLKIPNDPPYCDTCHHYLEPRDLFPFFSWVVNRGKCRFCGVAVPAMYAVIEWSSVMLFNLAYFQFGLTETMILVIALGMFLIIMASHYFENKRYYNEVLIAVTAFSALLRVLHDATIYGFARGAYVGLVVGLVGWGAACLKAKHKIPFPHPCIMPILAGLALGRAHVFDFLLVALPLYAALKASSVKEPRFAESAGVVSGCAAIIILTLYPHLVMMGSFFSR
jgi:hypothetical protein